MAKEYIDKHKAQMVLCMLPAELDAEAVQRCIEAVHNIPAADVRPVVRGRWIRPTRVPDSMLAECSVCGFDTEAYTFTFCPKCGAMMMEDEKWEI